MKKTTLIITIIFSCILLTSCKKEVKNTYYDTGELMCEYIQKNGIEHGPFKCYYESGALRIEGTYKNGNREGIAKTYYENGQLKTENTIKDDQPVGTGKLYYENGSLMMKNTFEDGLAMTETCYEISGAEVECAELEALID